MPKGLTKRRSAHRTQWAAQFAVASELCKQGYQVALTLGNHPSVDLMVISPKGTPFLIDVKGQYRENFWPISPKEPHKQLFYVLAYVPDKAPNRFFILTQKEVSDDIKRNTELWISRKPERAKMTDKMPGVSKDFARQHEDRWNKLPQ